MFNLMYSRWSTNELVSRAQGKSWKYGSYVPKKFKNLALNENAA
jgi:hypothetical protein